jgi:hypothetical protein
MEITYEQSAYLDMKYHCLEDVKEGRLGGVMLSDPDGSTYFESQGYVRIGSATVVLRVNDEDEIHRNQLDALNNELAAVRADNQQRENAILHRISKLQALTYVEAS